jgi:hypothetical protein
MSISETDTDSTHRHGEAASAESERLPPERLNPHPKNEQIYGDISLPEHFVEDVRQNGVKTPIVVTSDSHFVDDEPVVIISGHRRREAALETDHDVPIGEWREYDTPEQELADLLRENDYRNKTFSQKMGEAATLEDLVRAEAKDRQGTRTDLTSTLREGESGETANVVGKRVGIGSANTYRKARKVWQAATDGDGYAKEQVKLLNDDEQSVSGAYREWRAAHSDTENGNSDDSESGETIDESDDDFTAALRGSSGYNYYRHFAEAIQRFNHETDSDLSDSPDDVADSVASIVERQANEGGGVCEQ